MRPKYPSGPKSEWARQAEEISRGDIRTTPEDLPMLMEWLQDMNWPGATIIARHLISFGPDLVEPIRRVIESGDSIWIHWVLSEFADFLIVVFGSV